MPLLETLVNRFKNDEISDTFLYEPKGFNEIAWLVHYRKRQINNQTPTDTEQLLQDLWEQILKYQEGDIHTVNNMIELLLVFKEQHPDKVQPWMEGTRQECLVMIKKQKASEIQSQLDKIDIRLISRMDKARLEHTKKYPKFTQYEKEFENKAKKGWITTFLNFFNIARDFRKDRYLSQKMELIKTQEKIRKEYQEKHKSKIQKLESKLKSLKKDFKEQDNIPIRGVAQPLSFEDHQYIKRMVVEHRGMMIGGLAQSKVISLGSKGGLCYGFTKEWILQMNTLRDIKEDHILIEKLDLYSKKSSDSFASLTNRVNNLSLTDEAYQHYVGQYEDRKKKNDLKINLTDPTYPAELLKELTTCHPPSIILCISKPEGGSHALGIVETEHGLWFHDSNRGAFFFPADPSLESAKVNFSNFLKDYLNDTYPKFKSSYYVHLPENSENLQASPILSSYSVQSRETTVNIQEEDHPSSKKEFKP
jgi:hypothetical protein